MIKSERERRKVHIWYFEDRVNKEQAKEETDLG